MHYVVSKIGRNHCPLAVTTSRRLRDGVGYVLGTVNVMLVGLHAVTVMPNESQGAPHVTDPSLLFCCVMMRLPCVAPKRPWGLDSVTEVPGEALLLPPFTTKLPTYRGIPTFTSMGLLVLPWPLFT